MSGAKKRRADVVGKFVVGGKGAKGKVAGERGAKQAAVKQAFGGRDADFAPEGGVDDCDG